jgi:hypothetical protein
MRRLEQVKRRRSALRFFDATGTATLNVAFYK